MALRPRNAEHPTEQDFLFFMTHVEPLIDNAIRKQYLTSTSSVMITEREIEQSTRVQLTKGIKAAIVHTYTNAGWIVTQKEGKQEGPYFSLKPKASS
ncbi:MAG: hypothetical protein ACOCXQ_04500 [Patescibacteria group bacterium]